MALVSWMPPFTLPICPVGAGTGLQRGQWFQSYTLPFPSVCRKKRGSNRSTDFSLHGQMATPGIPSHPWALLQGNQDAFSFPTQSHRSSPSLPHLAARHRGLSPDSLPPASLPNTLTTTNWTFKLTDTARVCLKPEDVSLMSVEGRLWRGSESSTGPQGWSPSRAPSIHPNWGHKGQLAEP